MILKFFTNCTFQIPINLSRRKLPTNNGVREIYRMLYFRFAKYPKKHVKNKNQDKKKMKMAQWPNFVYFFFNFF